MSEENTKVSAAKGSKIVVMKDGRSVDFGLRGKLKKVITFTGEGADRVATIVTDVIDGSTFTTTIGLNHPMLLELAAHGYSQKQTDCTTKAEQDEDVAAAVENQIAQIEKGVWVQRAASADIFRGFSDLVEAIRRIKGYEVGSPDALNIRTVVASKSEEQIKAYRSNSQIKQVLAIIAAEKAAERADRLAKEEQTDSVGLEDL